MLKTHYRQPINWTTHGRVEAALELESFAQVIGGVPITSDEILPEVVAALEDDLNTPLVVAELHKASRPMRTSVNQRDINRLANSLALLGLGDLSDINRETVTRVVAGRASQKVDEGRVAGHIAARAAARAAKDFVEADRIRKELEAMGIALKDAKDPKTGELVTTWEVKR